jgi:competence protein ComEC
VGQGNSALIRFPEGKTMLIDGGGSSNGDFDTGKNIAAPFLLGQGVWRMDYLVLTHPHPDHYCGLRYIAKNFSIREFWNNGDVVDDSYFWGLEKTIAKKKCYPKAHQLLPADTNPRGEHRYSSFTFSLFGIWAKCRRSA